MPSKIDEVSRAIGEIQGKVEGFETSQAAIFRKLEEIHAEQVNQKVQNAKMAVKMGLFSAVATLGVMKGVEMYLKTYFTH